MEFRNGDEAAMGLGELDMGITVKEPEARPGKAVKMEKKDEGSESLVVETAAAEAMAEALKAAVKPADDSKSVRPRRFDVVTDESRGRNATLAIRA